MVMTNLFTETGNRLYTTTEAADYILKHLPRGEKWGRENRPYENVYWHIYQGNLTPYQVEGQEDADRRTILIAEDELNRFLANRPRRGQGRKINLADYKERVLAAKDNNAELRAIAEEVGCSVQTLKRRLKKWEDDEN